MRSAPSLLDRLAYRADGNGSYAACVISEQEQRRLLLRDLEWLLNTTRLDSVHALDGYDAVRASVLNYGIDSLAGRLVSGVREEEVARSVKQALERFEPRLQQVTVKAEKEAGSERGLRLTIDAQLLERPLRRIQVQGLLDLDDGLISLTTDEGTS